MSNENLPPNQLSEADRQGLSAVADAVSASPRADLAKATADQLVHRAAASMADVHTHALTSLGTIEDRISRLKEAIEAQRVQTEAEIRKFVTLVSEGVEVGRLIDIAVDKIADQVIRQAPAQTS